MKFPNNEFNDRRKNILIAKTNYIIQIIQNHNLTDDEFLMIESKMNLIFKKLNMTVDFRGRVYYTKNIKSQKNLTDPNGSSDSENEK